MVFGYIIQKDPYLEWKGSDVAWNNYFAAKVDNIVMEMKSKKVTRELNMCVRLLQFFLHLNLL